MHEFYRDIRDRIPEDPIWFDEHAVPRYAPFSPGLCADVYAKEAVLLRILCQSCGYPMDVAVTCGYKYAIKLGWWKREQELIEAAIKGTYLVKEIQENTIHYGDPPYHACPGGGETMNCVDVAVLQYWRNTALEWQRFPEYEVLLEARW